MLKTRFDSFISFIKNKRIVILTHDLVDIDGLASSFALKYFLLQYLKDQDIKICFSDFTKSTKTFFRNISNKFPKFDFTFYETFEVSNTDVILIVDTNNLKQIELRKNIDFSDINIPYLFIDHHYIGEKLGGNNLTQLNLTFEDFSSTAEIILKLFETYHVSLTIPLRTLMITAMITDSGFFKHGNNDTIRNVGTLIGDDINIQDIFLLLKREIDISAKIARIKGMQRVKLIREGDYLIGITKVSSYGASVAKKLITLGFDVAIVLSKEIGKNRINTRAQKSVCINTGLHLGKILEEISNKYSGNGGGHDGAATLTSTIESDTIITQIIEKIKQHF
jgi:nanoRNase/pAp phosphatase (c-di-AMP/oligoRNAs hydrolase)